MLLSHTIARSHCLKCRVNLALYVAGAGMVSTVHALLVIQISIRSSVQCTSLSGIQGPVNCQRIFEGDMLFAFKCICSSLLFADTAHITTEGTGCLFHPSNSLCVGLRVNTISFSPNCCL